MCRNSAMTVPRAWAERRSLKLTHTSCPQRDVASLNAQVGQVLKEQLGRGGQLNRRLRGNPWACGSRKTVRVSKHADTTEPHIGNAAGGHTTSSNHKYAKFFLFPGQRGRREKKSSLESMIKETQAQIFLGMKLHSISIKNRRRNTDQAADVGKKVSELKGSRAQGRARAARGLPPRLWGGAVTSDC